MATYSKEIPSGSTDGQGIKIVATATAGTSFHAAHATAKDEIHMWLTNTSAADVQVTVEFGGATAPDQNAIFNVPAKRTIYAIPGWILTNSKTVKAFAGSANVVNMVGYVNRITP